MADEKKEPKLVIGAEKKAPLPPDFKYYSLKDEAADIVLGVVQLDVKTGKFSGRTKDGQKYADSLKELAGDLKVTEITFRDYVPMKQYFSAEHDKGQKKFEADFIEQQKALEKKRAEEAAEAAKPAPKPAEPHVHGEPLPPETEEKTEK